MHNRTEVLKRDYEAIAHGYMRDVLERRIVTCEYTKLACERQLKDLGREGDTTWPFAWDARKGARVCSFIERLPHVKGPLANKRELLVLEPWQVFKIMVVFSWVWKETGLRRFRRVYETEARKNGKTSIEAALALYMMVADGEEGPEVYALATVREQASIVWRIARDMLKKSHKLQELYRLAWTGGHSSGEQGRGAIFSYVNNATFQCKPGDPGDGDNPHFVVVDEYHEHKSNVGYDAMYNGMGSRNQPLMWVITTSGYDKGVPCYDLQIYAQRVLKEVEIDETLFAFIFTLDEGDDPYDPQVWPKANPNLGVSVTYESLYESANEAKSNASKRNTFLTKRANIWTKAGAAYFDVGKWDACARKDLELRDYVGCRAWIGLDLASVRDVAAVFVLVESEESVKWKGFVKLYLPQEVVEERAQGTYNMFDKWAKQGLVELIDGPMIDQKVVERYLNEVMGLMDVQRLSFDAWQAHQLVQNLQERDAPAVQVPNSIKNMSPAMKKADGLVASRMFEHDGNAAMSWMIGNVVARRDEKGNVMPRKLRDVDKIDGPVAMMYALTGVEIDGLEDEGGEESVYEVMAKEKGGGEGGPVVKRAVKKQFTSVYEEMAYKRKMSTTQQGEV